MQQAARSVAAAALAQVKKEAARVMGGAGGYSVGILRTVRFVPDRVLERKDGSLQFPWVSQRGVLNGLMSTHGGALASLADVFTRVHLGAVLSGAQLATVNFEISYFLPIAENTECVCVTRIVNTNLSTLAFMDFSFEDENTGTVFARGTHIFSCCE